VRLVSEACPTAAKLVKATVGVRAAAKALGAGNDGSVAACSVM
jgi:hypothetical protein